MPVKRLSIALALSLFVGVFATISTAWLFPALSDDDGGMDSDSLLESTGPWHVFASRRVGVWEGAAMISLESSAALHIDDANIPEWSRLRDLPEYSRGDPMPMIFDSGYGWPLLSMWSSIDAERGWRGLRGRCHSCGYDLRNDLSAGCPECGWQHDIASFQGLIKET